MWSARHRKSVAAGWVLIVVVALGTCSVVEANTDIEMEASGEAGKAAALFEERFGEKEAGVLEFVTFSHPSLTVDDPAYRDTVRELQREFEGLVAEQKAVVGGTTVVRDKRIVAGMTSYYDTGLPREPVVDEAGNVVVPKSPFVEQNESGGDVTFALVELDGEVDEAVHNVDPVLDAVAKVEEGSDGFEIFVGGEASLTSQIEEIVGEDFARASFLNLPITFAILILAFGALLAAGVPLALGFAAIITANGILAVVSQAYPLSVEYSEMVLLMGLATGIDYSLFVITRYRRERAAGRSNEEALQVASGTSGKAVVFAGTTVVLAISGMFLVDNPVFRSLALAAIVVVMLAVVMSVTLLPALVAMLGDNVNRLRVPFLGTGTGEGGGIWGRIVDRVLARPIIPAIVTTAALIALAVPGYGYGFAVPGSILNLGFNGPRSFPEDAQGTKALIALEENFTLGLVQPAVVVVDAGEKQNVFAQNIQASTAELVRLVEEDAVSAGNPQGLYGPPAQEPEFNDAGDTELLFIPVNGDSGEPRAIDAVNKLRDDLIPDAFRDGSADALVTGATANNIDFRDSITFRTPFVFAFVLGLAFILLLVMFRSIIIPIKAIILNLLSVGAAYGVLVLVFQEGWLLQGVLDFKATGIIESWLPLFLFAILFGLSMDYHMFVLGRIKEQYEKGASNEEAVSLGIKATAATITSAAAIMVAVFSVFAFMRLLGMKQFGVGLGVAIFVDATVIRSLLLPASMKLLGDLNWYLPSWLQWIPRVKMAE
jgi:uncharacterized membrane protein YdfJ with MMPL/SSD domain